MANKFQHWIHPFLSFHLVRRTIRSNTPAHIDFLNNNWRNWIPFRRCCFFSFSVALLLLHSANNLSLHFTQFKQITHLNFLPINRKDANILLIFAHWLRLKGKYKHKTSGKRFFGLGLRPSSSHLVPTLCMSNNDQHFVGCCFLRATRKSPAEKNREDLKRNNRFG